MPDIAVPERIATELLTRLSAITTANGYNFTASQVVRLNRKGDNWTQKHLSIALTQEPETRNEELDHPGSPPANAYDVEFQIKCVSRDQETSGGNPATTAKDTIVNDMIAAVRKAIAVPAATWHQMGGVAINSMFGDSTIEDSSEGEATVGTVTLMVTYRVSETDPYVVRA